MPTTSQVLPPSDAGSGHDVDDELDSSAIASLRAADAGGGCELLVRCIQIFAGALPGMVRDLSESLDAGDTHSVRRLAHTLKSNSATMGAMRLPDACRELEDLAGEGSLDGAPQLVEQVKVRAARVLVLLDVTLRRFER